MHFQKILQNKAAYFLTIQDILYMNRFYIYIDFTKIYIYVIIFMMIWY